MNLEFSLLWIVGLAGDISSNVQPPGNPGTFRFHDFPGKPAPNSTSNSWPRQTEINKLIRKSLPPKMIGVTQLSGGFDSDAVFIVSF